MAKTKNIAIIFMISLAIIGISNALTNPYAPDEYYREPMIGSNNAKVKIVAYIGFQEPFSARWFKETLPLILSEYNRREVSITFVHAPLSFFENEANAMKAAECAARQDSYFDYIKTLYGNQNDLSVPNLFTFAENQGLNMKKFEKCFNSKKTVLEVESDKNFAFNVLGVEGVPTFFIDGEMLVGAQPFETFKQVIDKHLS